MPGAIAALGAAPVLVEVTEGLTLDLDDLAAKMARHPEARTLLLSHMRGHLADMARLMALCDAAGCRGWWRICAHTMGAAWDGVPSGRWGRVGCFSTQSYKHLDSGEGGLIVTDDADLAARMVLMSGSYMLHGRNGAAPDAETFARHAGDAPNVSGRMDELRAAILRPQLADLADRARRWNDRYRALEAAFREAPGLRAIDRPGAENPSSAPPSRCWRTTRTGCRPSWRAAPRAGSTGSGSARKTPGASPPPTGIGATWRRRPCPAPTPWPPASWTCACR